MRQGEGQAREAFQGGRPTAAGGGAPSPGSRSPSGQPQGVPYGFRDFGQFREFAGRFRDRMRELYPDLDMGFQGSSVTGRSAETGAPFDEGRVSDYDQPGRLAEALGVEWVRHESDYRGVYFAARPPAGNGKLRLQSNDLRDGDEAYYQEPDFPEYRYLLFVDKFDRPDEVRGKLAALPQWRFLYRSVVE
ncbi:hypothetical protein Ade02nite_00640 [Paractinoplanes deccanensis]|uniref:Uncharacterized protein n=1 Tax=Paractinoplanes deccanensis TaxID=113561 RepID=A0ABQ3XUK6_9ACTN|nr:hypothetical protein Ade02nite_00640 [Actinoplanes deccanensis]